MTTGRKDEWTLPAWVDRSEVEELLDGGGEFPFDSFRLGGCLLRARQTSAALRNHVRAALPGLISEHLADLEDGAVVTSNDVTEQLDSLRKAWEGNEEVEADAVLSLLLLREDLEAFDEALAAASMASVTKNEIDEEASETWERANLLLSESMEDAHLVDEGAEPLIDRMRACLLEAATRGALETPEELLSVLSRGANPWWIELIDPVLTAAALAGRRRFVKPAEKVAASRPEGKAPPPLSMKVSFDDELVLSFYHDAKGRLVAQLTGTVPGGGEEDLELVWFDDSGEEDQLERSVVLSPVVDDVYQGTVPDSLPATSFLVLRRGDRVWAELERSHSDG